MASCYSRLIRTLVALVSLVAASAGRAPAQFMYLDADGDGVPSSADVIPPGGTVTFDVWLVTDRNRDGTAASCAEYPAAPLTIGGYSFVLKVANGNLTFSEVTNRIPSFTLGQGPYSSGTSLGYGRFGATELPPGVHRLATVTARTTLGTPAISIVPASESGTFILTGFYSSCPGLEYDGVLKLGIDWFDVQGLRYGGQANRAPTLEPPAPMTVAEADTAVQGLSASDVDGQPIELSKASGPAYMTLAQTASGAGTAAGEVHLRPGYADAGASTGTVRATDGILSTERSFDITVTNVNRPPVFAQPYDMEVEAGTSAEQTLDASDPDGGLELFLVMNAPFGRLVGLRYQVYPNLSEQEATYPVTVRATDGELSVERSFHVRVFGAKHPPTLGPVADMVAAEGDTVAQVVYASDADAEDLSFYAIHFFPFMRLVPISRGPYEASARVVLTPRAGDRGRATVGVGVTDGIFQVSAAFNITILETYPGATWLALEVDPRPSDIVWDSIRFDARDGAFGASGAPESGVGIVFVPPVPSTLNAAVQLSCLPAQRPACVSDRVNWWELRFEPPVGGTLAPGVYTGAAAVRDEQHAGLRVRPFCGTLVGCSVTDSWFEVEQLEFGPAGLVVSFGARFEQRCAGSPTVLSGKIRYNAALPVFVDSPSRVQAHAGDPLVVDLPVRGAAAGPYSVASPDLPPGALLAMVSGDRASLTWTPRLDQAGSYDLWLIAEAAGAEPDTTRMTICVDVPGAVTAAMDVNRTRVITTNQGDVAWDAVRNQPGVFHPGGSDIPVARAVGLVLGARVNGQIRLALAGYEHGYGPGPLVNGAPTPPEPRFKNYTVRRGEPFGYDWEFWPADLGAPLDESGRPLVIGDATIWSLYNDARTRSPSDPPRTAPPLGVEVRQTTWASASITPLGDVVFQRFQIRNASADTLEDAYAAWSVDPTTLDYYGGHVGYPSRDVFGCDTTLALGYAYTGGNYGRPNAVGLVVLHGPVIPRADGGTDTLGLSAYQDERYGSPDPASGTYNQLRGLLPDGSPRHEFDDPARPVTPFAYTGDPLTGQGWLDPYYFKFSAPYYVSTGPFRLAPGEEQEVVIAIVGATGGDRLDAVRRLRAAATAARGTAFPSANRAPTITAPESVFTHAGETLVIDLSASDPDWDPVTFIAGNLPPGATYVLTRPGQARLTWTPTDAQVGVFTISLLAHDGRGGLTTGQIVIIVLRRNHAPLAEAGGPYGGRAGVPIEFDGSGSIDPDGDVLSFAWEFGDGGTGGGARPAHAYARGGLYTVALIASDGALVGSDSTTAAVAPIDTASAWVLPSDSVIRLRSARPLAWIAVEPRGGSFQPSDIVLSTVTLARTDVALSGIAPQADKSRVGVDEDHDGIAEIVLAFGKENLRTLFQDLPPGRSEVPVVLAGDLPRGAGFVAAVLLAVEAGRPGLDALVAPNPFNPTAMLTIHTPHAGPVRITLFSVSGRAVRTLLDTPSLPAGYHDIAVDRRAADGVSLSSGLYFYRVETKEGAITGRLMILK